MKCVKFLKDKMVYIVNTAHFIDPGIDTGAIIMQSKLNIKDFLNYESVLNLQSPMLKKIWLNLENDVTLI